MITFIMQFIMCSFVIGACIYSIRGEIKRQKQVDEIVENIRKKNDRN